MRSLLWNPPVDCTAQETALLAYLTRTRQSGMFWLAGASVTLAALALLLGRACINHQAARHHHQATIVPMKAATAHARIRAIWLLCSVGVVFWLTMQQAGTALVLFAESNTWTDVALFHLQVTLGPGRFASMHCLLVLLLLPAMVLGFYRLGRLGREPSAFAKMIWGCILSAAAFGLLGMAGLRGGDTGRVNPAWLMGCYVLLSGAEVLLSPMSLALVTRLALPQKMARMVGLWFGATAAGNGLSRRDGPAMGTLAKSPLLRPAGPRFDRRGGRADVSLDPARRAGTRFLG
jgi:POT family proton-dependent oligopeptide transporter